MFMGEFNQKLAKEVKRAAKGFAKYRHSRIITCFVQLVQRSSEFTMKVPDCQLELVRKIKLVQKAYP